MVLDCCLCLILHARYLKEEIEDVDQLSDDQQPLKDIEWATMWSDRTDFRVLAFLLIVWRVSLYSCTVYVQGSQRNGIRWLLGPHLVQPRCVPR